MFRLPPPVMYRLHHDGVPTDGRFFAAIFVFSNRVFHDFPSARFYAAVNYGNRDDEFVRSYTQSLLAY